MSDDLKVGSWRLTEWLAEGGMGEVFVAKHDLMGREAVVKLLHSKHLNDDDVVRRFLNEARAASAIRHPGIVEIFDLGSSDGKVYIVMERLYGETLADRIARAPLILGLVMTLVKQLAGALSAAHKHGIVHRDLKPDNLYVIDDPDVAGGKRIKILDFGVAKLAPEHAGSGMTAQGMVFGTPAYMAPEQCRNSAQVDHRADLYAIGCIMYEMLCSEPPFGHGGLELFAAHLRDEPPPLKDREADVSEDVEAIVRRLLAKEPDERFQDCDELLAALDEAKVNARRRAEGKRRRRRSGLAFAETVPPPMGAVVEETAGETVEETAKIARPEKYKSGKKSPAKDSDAGESARQRSSSSAKSDAPGTTDGTPDSAPNSTIDGADGADRRSRETRPKLADPDTLNEPPARGKHPRKAPASPTTHRHATGQIIEDEDEPDEATRPRRMGWVAAVAAAVLLGGGGMAYKMVAERQSSDQAASTTPDLPPIPVPAPAPPEPPPPPPPTGEEFLVEGQKALQDLQFADAAIAAKQALDIAKPDSEIHVRATELQDKAREGLKFQWAYDSFLAAVNKNDIRSAVYAYEQLPADSVFRDRAKDKYLSMRDAWLVPYNDKANKLAGRKRCGKIDDLAQEVRFVFPESAEPLDEMADKCYEKRDRRRAKKRKKKEEKPPEPPPIDDKLLPNTVPKIVIRQRLKKYNKRMRACLIENPVEVTSKEKTVPVIATLQIAPNGKLTNFEISPRSDALSSCLYFEVRQEDFPPAREATTMKFSVGKGRVRNVKDKPEPEAVPDGKRSSTKGTSGKAGAAPGSPEAKGDDGGAAKNQDKAEGDPAVEPGKASGSTPSDKAQAGESGAQST